jgi:N-acetylglutamate synthase-like GNAT family acetyltransferase
MKSMLSPVETELPRMLQGKTGRAALLRLITPEDNEAVARLIVDTLAEFEYVEDCPANDPEVNHMARYIAQAPYARFYVLEDPETKQVVGCGGFEPLKGFQGHERICELIKFYVRADFRDHGLGGQLLQQALHDARTMGYDTMYYEVTPRLFSKSLFERLGFFFVEDKLGNNGHFHPEINIFVVHPFNTRSSHHAATE